MTTLLLALALSLQATPSRFNSNWSDAYWLANGRFQECYDRRMEQVQDRFRVAHAMLDDVMSHCQRQWDGRVRELRADLRELHPTWPDATLDEYLERGRQRFIEDRLVRLRAHTGESPYPNIE